MSEHGVRYVLAKVRAKNVTYWDQDVADALESHRVPVEYSSALMPAFEGDVDVPLVLLGYQGNFLLELYEAAMEHCGSHPEALRRLRGEES